MVEFAVILPLFVVLTLGIIDFGRAFSNLIAIQGAAREGARVLALGKSETDVKNAAINSTAIGLTQSNVSVVLPLCPETLNPGSTNMATVRVQRQFNFVLPLLKPFNRVLSATAKMRCGL